MITDKDFILSVQFYPELYNKNGIADEKKRKQLWMSFAHENQIKSASAAENKWRQLVSKYLSCLLYDTPFAYEKEMQFMQMPLLGGGCNEDDNDIDEVELIKVLNSYEDCPPASKRQRVETTDVLIKDSIEHIRSMEHNNKENEQTKNNRSPVPNSNITKFNENLSETEGSMGSDKKDELNKTGKVTIKDDCGIPLASNVQSNVLSNISSENTGMSSSFTNLTSLELIFLGYAKVLQRMPLRLQLQTKRKIADIMDEAELKMYEEN